MSAETWRKIVARFNFVENQKPEHANSTPYSEHIYQVLTKQNRHGSDRATQYDRANEYFQNQTQRFRKELQRFSYVEPHDVPSDKAQNESK